MPPEIADSDDEFDLEVVPLVNQYGASAQNLDGLNEFEPEPTLSIDFDQFLSPTQRLSSFPSQNVDSTRQATGSTEKMLEGITEAQRAFAGGSSTEHTDTNVLELNLGMAERKRRHTAIEEGFGATISGESGKRRKTYGDRLRQKMLNAGEQSSEEAPSISGVEIEHSTGVKDVALQGSDSSLTRHLSMETSESSFQRERDRPRRVISLLNQSDTYSMHSLSTSRASMGDYQSINLDFRGLHQTIDVDTNPFGVVTQMTQESEGVTQFHQEDGVVGREVDTSEQPHTADEVFVNPSLLNTNTNTIHAPNPSKQLSPEITHQSSQIEAEDHQNAGRVTRKKSKRSRGKSKTSIIVSTEDAVDDSIGSTITNIEQANDVHMQSEEPRAPTVEPLSQVSQAPSSPKAGKCRKRKSTRTEVDTTPLAQNRATESPFKIPSSDLKLSDPDMIGQPREMYKPRPSRSRSKRIVEEDIEEQKAKAETVVDTTAMNPELIDTADPVATPSKTPKKSGRKSKVKRAKTSAAALLKKSQQMLSDGEDDVLWLDSKPSAVKLDLPPEIKPLKTEGVTDEINSRDEVVGNTIELAPAHKVDSRSTGIIIQLPAPEEAAHSAAIEGVQTEPKKRGRPKKAAQPTDPAPREEPDELAEPNTNTRTALKDKDPNTTTSKSQPQTTHKPDLDNQQENTPNPENENEDDEETPNAKASLKPANETIRPIHSPLKPSPNQNTSPFGMTRIKYRIGLSKRTQIPSLLRRVDKSRSNTPVVKPSKRKTKDKGVVEDAAVEGDGAKGEAFDEDRPAKYPDRDASGNLIAWED